MKLTTAFLLATAVQQAIVPTSLLAQEGQSFTAAQMVDQMLRAETAAWNGRQHFLYRNQERSNRTDGHLWDEVVVETPDGSMQRLVSEDGRSLSATEKKSEDSRIAYLADHPNEFRRKAQRRRDDEARMPELLKDIPRMFLFQTVSSEGSYARIAFRPNPSFHEETYQDRVAHAMAGMLIIHTTDMRLCELDAHLEHKVEFGFGILGMLSDKTYILLVRENVSTGQWTTTKLRVHLDGRILFLKSISQDLDSSRYDFKPVAYDLKVAEAAAILRSNTF